jgi:hypothetical protein
MELLGVRPGSNAAAPSSLHSFCKAWAQRYIRQVDATEQAVVQRQDDHGAIAAKLTRNLRSLSVKAWGKTEALLSTEIIRHQIAPALVDPWSISQDIHQIYAQTLDTYADGITPERFAMAIAAQVGELRRKYTAIDPRVIGFASMQFHYTGQLLLQELPFAQRETLALYFKAVDDHLYMPLQRAYDAAAQYPYQAVELRTVRRLLASSGVIAARVVHQVLQAFPNHHCYSGPLGSAQVQTSSLRDVEMFQTYLWVSLLEGNVSAVQQELFPLCIMLYPVLNVRWELVRYMLMLLDHELGRHLSPQEWKQVRAYLSSMQVMFSTDVLGDRVCLA